MKTLRLILASLTFCLVFIGQSNAQTITNLTPCWFEVKANVIPTTACIPSGYGPLYGVPGGAVITVPTPFTHFVVAYGVKRLGVPVKLPGEPTCTFISTHFVGKCLGKDVFATYSAEDLTIHP